MRAPLLRLIGLALIAGLALAPIHATRTAQADSIEWTDPSPYGGAVNMLAVDPTDGNVVYAATGGGVYRSADAGGTWTRGITGMVNVSTWALAINPVTPTILYAAGASNNSIVRSDNSGASWTSVANTAISGVQVRTIAVHPVTPTVVFAGGGSVGLGRVLRSDNSGGSWITSTVGLTATSVMFLAINPTTPNLMYAGTAEGVFRSTDEGASWTLFNAGLEVNKYIRALAVDPNKPDDVYVSTTKVFSSTLGSAWAALSDSFGIAQVMTVDPYTDTTRLYAGSGGGGIHYRSEGDSDWTDPVTQPPNTDVYALAAGPNNVVYSGSDGDGVYKSTDGGANWTRSSNGLTAAEIMAIAVQPGNPSILYASLWQGGGIHKSTDGGLTWAESSTGLTNRSLRAIVIDPQNPDTLYVGAFAGQGAFKSTDGGDNWTVANTNLGTNTGQALAIDPVNPDRLYLGSTGEGLWRTTNAAASWFTGTTGITTTNITAIVVNPVTNTTVYAGSSQGMFRSYDSGDNWSPINNGFGANTHINTVLVHPITPTLVFAATSSDSGLYRSVDEGSTWVPVGIAGRTVAALAVDPLNRSKLYAAASDGVYVSTNGGASWSAFSPQVPSSLNRLNALAATLEVGRIRLLAGSSNASIFRFEVDVDVVFLPMIMR